MAGLEVADNIIEFKIDSVINAEIVRRVEQPIEVFEIPDEMTISSTNGLSFQITSETPAILEGYHDTCGDVGSA